ncbi:LysE family translocator [Blastococcus sp. SYSU DS0510]
MPDPAILPAFLGAVLVICLAPGPDLAFVMATGLRHGPRGGLLAALGMSVGMLVHTVAAAMGLAVMFERYPHALRTVQLLGACYLLHLAVQAVRPTAPDSSGPEPLPEAGHLLRRAAVTNLANPKIVLFFAAFLPQFTTAGRPLASQLLVLGLLFLLVGLTIDGLVGLGAGRLRTALAPNGAAATALNRAAACVYAVLAGLLLYEVLCE